MSLADDKRNQPRQGSDLWNRPTDLGQVLEQYRGYLTSMATARLDHKLRRRVGISDVVQDTLLGAVRDFDQFQGRSEAELKAWLKRILIHHVHHLVERHLLAKKRDLRVERPLSAVGKGGRSAMDQAGLVARTHTPSTIASRQEEHNTALDLLNQLRPDYRTVIRLRVVDGLSFPEVAERMGRNVGAVRMLFLRAIERVKLITESETATS